MTLKLLYAANPTQTGIIIIWFFLFHTAHVLHMGMEPDSIFLGES